MKQIRSLFPDWLTGILLTLLIIGAFLLRWYPLQTFEYKTYDFRAKLRQKKVSSPVVIVAIDDDSIKNIGRWPWPRTVMADLIDLLTSYGAKVIGINVLYTEEDRNSGLLEIRSIKQAVETIPDFEKNPQIAGIHEALMQSEARLDHDARLKVAIGSAGNVVLPLFFTLGDQAGNVDPEMPDFLKANSIAAPPGVLFPGALDVTPPLPAFASASSGLGHINLFEDEDGTVRREPLLIRYKNNVFPSFALRIVLKYLNYQMSDIHLLYGLKVGPISLPADERQKMLINYYGKYNSFPYYSFFDVVTNLIPAEVFKDKIVLIGHTGTGIAPLKVTPIQSAFPSVEIEANVIQSILEKNFISRPPWSPFAEVGIMAIFGIFISFILTRTKAGMGTIISVILLLGWNAAAVYLFVAEGFWLVMVYPSILLGLGYTVIVSKKFLITEKKNELVEADSIETNKMLGLSFQGQGMLDLAFEKFMKCPIEDESVKDLLYNLGLDFERKRMFNKAVSVYEHILKAGAFKDIKIRIRKLKAAGETMIFGSGPAKKDTTVLVDGTTTAPTLGRYEITKELGHGAMGTVYLGKDPKINRMVAIKTMRYDEIEPDQLEDTKQRFFREAEAAGKLSHPNIVTIYDAGEDYDVAYVAMELLEGHDLTTCCHKGKTLPLKTVLRIIGSIADALDYAHKNGVVHRDIKPANIMLLKRGEVKVTDFGIARVMASSKTQTGVVMGTPSYMSPEQVVGNKVDGRSDLFSLGVVFYELLTASKPFKGDSIASLMYNIANKPPQPIKSLCPSIPECVAYIVFKLLIKDTEKRYQQAGEVARDIALCMKKMEGK